MRAFAVAFYVIVGLGVAIPISALPANIVRPWQEQVIGFFGVATVWPLFLGIAIAKEAATTPIPTGERR